MGNFTKIQWTQRTWSPLRTRVKADAGEIAKAKGYASLIQISIRMAGHIGPHCERVSTGCGDGTGGGCYSEANNGRCLPSNGTGLPFDRRARDLIDPFLDEKMLFLPLRWKKACMCFVCSQTDAFGEWVTDEQLDRMFAVMALAPHITFQLLTKRPRRMLNYIGDQNNLSRFDQVRKWMALTSTRVKPETDWPLPNVHLGISCENQPTADERIPLLLQTPAARRFVSYEPALAAVNFTRIEPGHNVWLDALTGNSGWTDEAGSHEYQQRWTRLHQIIIGAESGPGARPFNEDWARSTRDQCVAAGCAMFYKQNAINGKKIGTPELDGKRWMQFPDTDNK